VVVVRVVHLGLVQVVVALGAHQVVVASAVAEASAFLVLVVQLVVGAPVKSLEYLLAFSLWRVLLLPSFSVLWQ
jgi:hypothetical protein